MTCRLIIKAGLVDLINNCIWTADVLKENTRRIGNGYRFDEKDQCVYWEGDEKTFLKQFQKDFPWSALLTTR